MMDYDTWKTTDFEYERQCKEDDARLEYIDENASDIFDAYMEGDETTVSDVYDYIDAQQSWEMLMEDMRKAYPDADKMAEVYQEFMAKTTYEMAELEADR